MDEHTLENLAEFICGDEPYPVYMTGSELTRFFQRDPAVANQVVNTPLDSKTGKPKNFSNWKLSEMIDVAHSLGWIDLDIKKFSHALREFRNLIHPYSQMLTGTYPDCDTCQISRRVVQAVCNDLATYLTNSG